MVEFRSLEVFYWVASLRSFGRAAERLYTTQPAVSQRIAALEEEFGGRLLERSGRSTVLTPKGRLLLEHAERLLRLRTEMIQAVAAPATVSGLVRLGVAETIVQTWLPAFIERVSRAHPAVTFDIEVDVTPRMRTGLLRQELDLAFLMGPVGEPGFVDHPLPVFPHAFGASPALRLPEGRVTAEALARHALVTYPRSTVIYQQLQQAFRDQGVIVPRIHVSSSIATIIRMAVDGIGISVLPADVMRPELARGELRLIKAEMTLPPIRFTASHRMAPDDTLVSMLAQIAVEVARSHAGTDKPG
ncbi:DNA-binding transcriptional regulator, LysR family [Roseomonas rosea]|uniref:DNA-binding transcriptional regulator, LysR family n=1 Tax=Muricoccus roseus TaxID=198092 RepID=A0A1M6ABK5_9PROT|nr:LysR family transcriptional regulator [Roseomonas rosea]SHI33807.1 DNA-binding transcriptional regulator, LysR family [Roseomonas rosea]